MDNINPISTTPKILPLKTQSSTHFSVTRIILIGFVGILIGTLLSTGGFLLWMNQRISPKKQLIIIPTIQISPTNPTSSTEASPITTITAQDNDLVAHNLFDTWLNQFKSSTSTPSSKLLDYTFTISKTTPKPTGNGFCFLADYSVKPVNINQSDWAAGNGQVNTSSGWIYHKVSFVTTNNVNGEYKIANMATSNTCN